MFDKFEALINEMGLSYSDVGRGTGMRPSVFTDWKAGRYTPKHDKLVKIANFLNVPVAYFEGEEDQDIHPISDFEYEIIKAYRKKGAELQRAICAMLDIVNMYEREKKEVTNLA